MLYGLTVVRRRSDGQGGSEWRKCDRRAETRVRGERADKRLLQGPGGSVGSVQVDHSPGRFCDVQDRTVRPVRCRTVL